MMRVRGTCVLAAVAFMLAGALSSCSSTAAAPGPAAPRPTLTFHLITKTTQKLDSIVWTGRQFLYVQNTTNTVWAAPPAGRPLHKFAAMPRLVEETRCTLSPGSHGFPRGAIFCHSPDNKIYEISPDGANKTVFASLHAPYPPAADGALAFDSVGRFGYRLLAATGRSGGLRPAGGVVYAIDSLGHVQQVGSYAGPGGADELVIAPGRFGSAAGDALLTVDAGPSGGAVVALDPSGRTRPIATFADGPNPIAPIPKLPSSTGRTRAPFPGLYLNDDKTANTYMAPASSLARYAGDVIVGTESPRALFWILEPRGKGFAEIPLRDNLLAGTSLEQAIFVRNAAAARSRLGETERPDLAAAVSRFSHNDRAGSGRRPGGGSRKSSRRASARTPANGPMTTQPGPGTRRMQARVARAESWWCLGNVAYRELLPAGPLNVRW